MIKPMEKIDIIFHKKNEREILDFLQKKEIIEIIEHQSSFVSSIDKNSLTNDSIKLLDKKCEIEKAEVEYVLNFLNALKKQSEKSLKQKIKSLISDSEIFITEQEIETEIRKSNFKKIVEECKKIEIRLNELNNLIEHLKNEKKIYQKWENFPYKIKDLENIENLKLIVGIVNKNKWRIFKQEIRKKIKLCELKIIPLNANKTGKTNICAECLSALQRLSQRGQINYPGMKVKFCLFYHLKAENKIQKILNEFKIEQDQEIKKIRNLPKAEIINLNREIKKALKEKQDLINKAINLYSIYKNSLRIIYDYSAWEEEKAKVSSQTAKTEHLVSLRGWVEKNRINEIERGLKKITDNFEVFRLKLNKDEKPPVIIENNKFLGPISIIGNMYGTPRSDEIDPTLPMAPFFILFFALCLGDAGYGLIMILLSILIIKILKVPLENRGFFYLLIYLGAAASVAGALFGGWFGINLEALPPSAIKNVLLKIKIMDPLKNPIQMLFVAFGLGVLQISIGIFLKMYWRIKTQSIKQGFLNEFPILCLIASLLLFGAAKTNIIPLESAIVKYIVLFCLIFFAFAKARKYKNLKMKILGGIGGFYDLIGYFSDVVSYSRLLALGLATTVIASVVNLTATIFSDMLPMISSVIYIFIIVFGHIFNLMLSAFGAFIHSMRLQFVEFFPKFMIGGGRKFNPFRKQGNYIKLKN